MITARLGYGSLRELEQNRKEILDHLTSVRKYRAEELLNPTSLYMSCIAHIVDNIKGFQQMTTINRSLPHLTRFHVWYYNELRMQIDLSVIERSDLPWEVVEDLHFLKDRVGSRYERSPARLFEMLERGIVCNVIPRLGSIGL